MKEGSLSFPTGDDESNESASSCSTNEGLALLLGGLDVQGIDETAWKNEIVVCETSINNGTSATGSPHSSTNIHENISPTSKAKTNTRSKVSSASSKTTATDDDASILADTQRVYCVTEQGTCRMRIDPPPVQVFADDRGRGLRTTRNLSKNTVIFTERADALAPVVCHSASFCNSCGRSLASACDATPNGCPALPLVDRHWPVPPLEFATISTTASAMARSSSRQQDADDLTSCPSASRWDGDSYGRFSCRQCKVLFCSQSCRDRFQDELGHCCPIQAVKPQHLALLTTRDKLDREDCGDDEDDFCVEQVDAAVVLAVRFFAIRLHNVRKKRSSNCSDNASNAPESGVYDRLCGNASELSRLAIGRPVQDVASGELEYSLDRVYDYLVKTWSVTDEERRQGLCLKDLETFAAKAARNGIGVQTHSPFQAYYASLIQSVGGRGSQTHEDIKRSVSQSLGVDELTRGLDRQVNERVSPSLAALFCVTACINHSCDPNAQVRSQEYVDCRIDLIALRDIARDEEITISYLSDPLRRRRANRQRELQGKYLFSCACVRCSKPHGSAAVD